MPGIPPTRFAYLGPEGTFAEAALLTLPAAARGTLLPQPSVHAAIDAVRTGEADAAVVPLEPPHGPLLLEASSTRHSTRCLIERRVQQLNAFEP